MTGLLGEFRVGEDVAVALDAVSGDVANVATITAKMQRSLQKTSFVPDDDHTAVEMTVVARAASGDIPAGWNLTLPAATSAQLASGFYGIDAKLIGTSGSIDITDTTALIRMTKGAH